MLDIISWVELSSLQLVHTSYPQSEEVGNFFLSRLTYAAAYIGGNAHMK